MESKNTIKKYGIMETILPKFGGNDTIKVYINPLTGETIAGCQKGEEKHGDYLKSGRTTILDSGNK